MTPSDAIADPATPFAALGGDAAVRRLVEAFYDQIAGDPAYAELLALHAPDLGPVRQSLTGFLTGWLGGPRDWFEAHPGLCMMSLHRAMAITPTAAGQWTAAMDAALRVAEVEPDLAAALSQTFGRMAAGMMRR